MGASEMARLVKVLASELDHWSSIPGAHVVERDSDHL